MKKYTLLLVGGDLGIVGKQGEKFPESPSHYERLNVVDEPTFERLVETLRFALKRMESNLSLIEWEMGQCRELDEVEQDGDLPREIAEARALLAELEATK